MSPRFIVLCLALLGLLGCSVERPPRDTRWKVYFSPRGGATEAITNALAAAKTEVKVQAYSFTSAPIAGALVEAHRRGVKIEVILDKSQRTATYSSADFLANSGVPVFIDAEHAIAHSKVMIIDQAVVITGSFNFSKAAEESNAENMLVVTDPDLAAEYLENWRRHRTHSVGYAGKLQALNQPANVQARE